jgi:pimeloyl-ACP methyl ester carboxylesterase
VPEPVIPPAQVRGSGPPLLLVHAFPLDGRMWAPQLEALAGHLQVVVPDLRGFGAAGEQVTDPVQARLAPGGWLDLLADDLARLLDQLGLERVTLAGLSLGGYVAFAFLRRHRARLAALALIATKAPADGAEAAKARLEMADRVLAEGVGFVPEVMLPRLLGQTSLRSRPDVVEQVTRLILEQQPAAIAAAQRGMAARPDSTGLLGGISVPTLVVVGAEDQVTPPDESRAMAAAIPDGRLAVIDQAGHLVCLEQADRLNQLVYRFVSEVGQFPQ